MHLWQIFSLLWLVYAVALNAALFRREKRPAIPSIGSPESAGPVQLLIIGATGGTGRELVRQALEQGHEVTAFVRNPTKLNIQHPNLRIVQGDVLDYTSVQTATTNQDAVLSALGHKQFFRPTIILSEGTVNIMRAMKACQVSRFICESSLGVRDAVGRLGVLATLLFVPLVLPFYFWDRVRQEELISEENGLDWIIVRPGTLTNGRARGQYHHGPRAGSYVWPCFVSRADVAAFMLQQVHDNRYLGQTPGICY